MCSNRGEQHRTTSIPQQKTFAPSYKCALTPKRENTGISHDSHLKKQKNKKTTAEKLISKITQQQNKTTIE